MTGKFSRPIASSQSLFLLLLVMCQVCSPPLVHAQAAPPISASPKHQDTNVIFISIDTLRHDHLGCYGYNRNTSPNIDRLAERSVLFENFISQAVLTALSQMSIFSSQYPRVNGLVSFLLTVDTITNTNLPNIMKLYGYTNAAFLSSPEFFHPSQIRTKGKYRNSFEDLFHEFIPVDAPRRRTPVEALDWIKKNKEKKFFLWLAIGTVHFPYTNPVPEPYKSMYDPAGYTPFFCDPCGTQDQECKEGIGYGVLSRIYDNTLYVDSKPVHTLTKEDDEYIVGRYDAGIHYTDLFVGEVMSLIQELELDERTLVVLHSTHGEDLGEHGYYMHYDLYDTEVKNALILNFPGDSFGGKRISRQVQGIDVMPTILDYLDIPINHESQGNSLVELIKTGKDDGLGEYAYMNRTPFWEYLIERRGIHFDWRSGCNTTAFEREALGAYSDRLSAAFSGYSPAHPPHYTGIRTNDWKLIFRENHALLEEVSWWSLISGTNVAFEELELYDLKNDPRETNNVADDHPEVVEALKSQLLQWNAATTKEQERKDVEYDGNTTIVPYPGVTDP